MQKGKFTMDYYKKIGLNLYELNDKLVSRMCDIHNENHNKYSRAKAGEKKAELAYKALCTLRSQLEELMFCEYPNEASIYVFYLSPNKNQSNVAGVEK
jgi:hypothetical protein